MKLGGISISTPKLPIMPLNCCKLASRKMMTIHNNNNKKPLLMEDVELSDGNSRGTSKVVPKGFMAVYVGPQFRRFVIPISFLTMPDFRDLMDGVAEEFGSDFHADGALQIPCDEDHFEQILMTCFARKRLVSSKNNKIKLGKIPSICSH